MFGNGNGDTPQMDDQAADLGDPQPNAELADVDLSGTMTIPQNASVRDRVAVVEQVLAGLAHLSADDIDSDDLLDSVLLVERLRRFADSVSCRLLAEIEARKVTDTESGLMTATWLARQAHLPAAVAKRRVRIAKKLADDLPTASEALADGRIGLDQAGVLSDAANPRIAEQLDAATDELCDSIVGSTFGRWKNEVRALADVLDQDGGHDPANDIERNYLNMSMTGQTLVIRGELNGENALIAREALNKIADQLFTRFSRDNKVTPDIEVPNRKTLLALALVEAARRGLGSNLGRAPHPEATLVLTPTALESPAGFPIGFPVGGAPWFDLDGGASPNGLAGSGWPGGAGGARGARAAVPFEPPGGASGEAKPHGPSDDIWFTGASPPRSRGSTVGAAGSGSGHGGRSWRGFTVRDEQGVPLPRRSWDVLMCDPALYPIVVDSLGVPIDMGRQVRLATRAQRRAMAVRDGGCVFPGCEMPARWTEAHHETEWEHGGLTDLGDLASLCRHHHRVAHRPGWLVEVLENGTTRWTTPMGQVFAGQQHGKTVILPDREG